MAGLGGSVCGNIVPVNDGTPVDGGIHSCSANYSNSGAVNGNIALIQRAGCSTTALNAFVLKVRNAQLNGATMAIVYDNDATTNTYVSMGGSDPDITIPAIFIGGADGAKIRAALTGTTVGTSCVYDATLADLDGSFDNGVMSHEYGHGISNRLTGGGGTAGCMILDAGTNANPIYTQAAGEGWSDFFALWMTTKPTDKSTTKRYMGAYVWGATTGLRAYPYTYDMSATAGNPQTYGLITKKAYYQESHGLGEIWTSALWDLNWQFIAKYGYNTDFYGSTGGNNKCLKLVLDACKIQPCNPSFLQARNAILKADSLANLPAVSSPNRALIWTVFARRGMGYSAVAGDRGVYSGRNVSLLTGIVEAFDMPPGLSAVALASRNASATNALEAYPNPAADRLSVRTQLNSNAPVQVTMLDVLGKIVLAPVAVPAAQMQQSGTSLDISQLANGVYIVRVVTTEGTYTTKVTVQH
ncbi:MAG: M36 family metallopeptidase [Janthinobacterium lividum]